MVRIGILDFCRIKHNRKNLYNLLEKEKSLIKKIYCAGPLFNNREKDEMQEIAQTLEQNNFQVFLPHRDGLEFASLSPILLQMGFSPGASVRILNKAIFILDVFHVLDSHGLVLNLNGRVPDEGAMVEAGIAWNAGKKIVLYKNDSRSLINGNDNPLLLGLSGFEVIKAITAIPGIFSRHFLQEKKTVLAQQIDNSNTRILYKKGRNIASITRQEKDEAIICRELIEILGESNAYTS